MLPDLDTPETIRQFVDTFYERLLADADMAPYFAHVDLAAHMPHLYGFWEKLLLGTGDYARNAMQPHMALHRRVPMQPKHFERWLHHFEATLVLHYTGPKATEALARARHIAALMQHKLGMM
jgi:hemoglobin